MNMPHNTHSAITWYNKNETNWRRTAKLVLLTCNICVRCLREKYVIFVGVPFSFTRIRFAFWIVSDFCCFRFLNSIHPDDAISPQRIKLKYVMQKITEITEIFASKIAEVLVSQSVARRKIFATIISTYIFSLQKRPTLSRNYIWLA